MSALAAGNETVRFELFRVRIAKRLSVERYRYQVFGPAGQDIPINEIPNCELDGLLLGAWLRDKAMNLLRENEFAKTFLYEMSFKDPVEFVLSGRKLVIQAIGLLLECKRSWVAQTVREDVSHGMYDHKTNQLRIPDKEFWSLAFDNKNWQEIVLEAEPELATAPGTIDIQMVLFNPAFRESRGAEPPLDDLIAEEKIKIDPPCLTV